MRRMSEKVERSRLNAQLALNSYRSTGGQDEDDLSAISDLIVDLMHLADKVGQSMPSIDGFDFTDSLRESAGAYAARLAGEHYDHERDPDHADEEV
jgi:hypothetical protein